MYYISKTLPVFILPLGFVLILLLASIILKKRAFSIAAFVILYISSMPIAGRFLLGLIEYPYEKVPASSTQNVDAIVVLSEGRTVAPGKAHISEWNDSDRFFGGIELFKAGKAPLLVFTGGAAPWNLESELEGKILAGYASAMGVSEASLRTTSRVINTKQEAAAIFNLSQRGWDAEIKGSKILLVTSAFHMHRAEKVFRKAGLEVLPYPVDFKVSPTRTIDIIDLLPSVTGLNETSIALREVYGLMMLILC